MKKLITVLILLVILLVSNLAQAVNLEFGSQANCQYSDQLKIDLLLGLYHQTQEVEGSLAGFGKGSLYYCFDGSQPAVQLVLSGEMRGDEYKILYGGYITPLSDEANLQIGLIFEKNKFENPVSIALKGDWQVGVGNLKLLAQDGLFGKAEMQYEMEKRLFDRILLTAEPGIRYEWNDERRAWKLPLLLSAELDLNESLSLKVQAANTFALSKSEESEPLTIGLYLEKEFDFRSKSNNSLEESKPVEMVKPQEPEKTTEPVEIIPMAPLVQSDEPELIEEIEVVALEHPEEEPESLEVDQSEQIEETEVKTDDTVTSTQKPLSYYDAENSTLYIEGEPVKVESLYVDNEVYFPIRETIEWLGGKVFWYEAVREICLVLEDHNGLLDVNQSVYWRNGYDLLLEDQLLLINGHYYVRLNDLLEMLDLQQQSV